MDAAIGIEGYPIADGGQIDAITRDVTQPPGELRPGWAFGSDDLIRAAVLDDDAGRVESGIRLRLAEELEMVLEDFVPA